MLTDAGNLPFTDLTDPVMFTDPFPRYAELRRTAPVSRTRRSDSGRPVEAYMLTRYEDVVTLLGDPRFSSATRRNRGGRFGKFTPRLFGLLGDSMLFKDDPDHKRLRGLVNQAFTPKIVQQMTDDVQQIVDELVEEAAKNKTVELVSDLAVPLPLQVVARVMGVPERERRKFSRAVERFTESPGGGSPLGMIKTLPTARRMVRLLERLARDRRANPDDRLISALVQAHEAEDALSDDEVVSMISLLLLAGHDTTSNLISSSVLALIDHPEQLERLRRDPSLIDTLVEEMLRFTTPVPCGVTRTALEDVEIAGVVIPRGASVVGMIISANRDEEVFDRPDELDIGRYPNKHISFAFGPHYCLGPHLARMEERMAIKALVERFDEISLAVPRGQLRYKQTVSLRGVQELPLTLR